MRHSVIWGQHCSAPPTHSVQFGDRHRPSPVFCRAGSKAPPFGEGARFCTLGYSWSNGDEGESWEMGRFLATTRCILLASQCCIWWAVSSELRVSSQCKFVCPDHLCSAGGAAHACWQLRLPLQLTCPA